MDRRCLLTCACGLLGVVISCGETSGGSGSGAGGGVGGGGGAGGAPLSDVPCQSQLGCVVADAELALHCTGPDDGSGVTTWDSVVSAHAVGTGQDGSCDVAAAGYIGLAFGDVNEGSIQIELPSFAGGGHYHLGGDSSVGESHELEVNAKGYRGDPSGGTAVAPPGYASARAVELGRAMFREDEQNGAEGGQAAVGTADTCSQGCELDVLPHDRPLGAIGEWVSYRFVVTCSNPLGTGEIPCGQCTMTPGTVTMDAACYFQPAQY